MTTTNFEVPTEGVTGPGFASNLTVIHEALASSHRSNTSPPVMYPGMLQNYHGAGQNTLRLRNAANTGWVTLLPDVTQTNGGLDNVYQASADFNDDVAAYLDANLDALIDARLASRGYTRQVFEHYSTPGFNTFQAINHNLGYTPKHARVVMGFRQSFAGYNPGFYIDMSGGLFSSPQSLNWSGVSVGFNSAQIFFSVANDINIIATNGSQFILTDPNVVEFFLRLYA